MNKMNLILPNSMWFNSIQAKITIIFFLSTNYVLNHVVGLCAGTDKKYTSGLYPLESHSLASDTTNYCRTIYRQFHINLSIDDNSKKHSFWINYVMYWIQVLILPDCIIVDHFIIYKTRIKISSRDFLWTSKDMRAQKSILTACEPWSLGSVGGLN